MIGLERAGLARDGSGPVSFPDAIESVRNSAVPRARAVAHLAHEWLFTLEAGTGAGRAADSALAELCGYALTEDWPAEADPGDLQPARAIRRALADGRMAAREIAYVCVEGSGPRAAERAAHAFSRGLGRFAANAVMDFGSGAVATCIGALDRGDVRGAVALVMGRDGVNLALAFSRPR